MIAAGYAVIMGLVGGLYFKSRAIDAMHKADCRVDCVAFGGLSDQPVKIPRSIAWAYRLCMAGAWGGGAPGSAYSLVIPGEAEMVPVL